MKRTKTLIFMGLKHSGKSLLGKLTAKELGFSFEDLDALIMEKAEPEGYPDIRGLYRRVGLPGFQRRETAALRFFFRKKTESDIILSLGGGTVENSAAMEILSPLGLLVYLSVDEEVLYSRIIGGGLPPFLEGEKEPRQMFHELYLKRSGLCRAYADTEIALPDQPPTENVKLILSFLKEKLHVW
jgi:shikimate kinase